MPIAWSPSNRYLAVTLQQDFPNASRVQVIDTQTGAILQTGFTSDFGSTPNPGTIGHIFFGWLDDNTFLGAIAPLVIGPENIEAPGASKLVRVDLNTGKQTAIGSIPGWVVFRGSFAQEGASLRIAANGHYLFYAAYSAKGSTAYLHRYDLVARTDTRLVSLGLYANGGCQGTTVCGWTAGWDATPNGAHVVYHKPGPTISPSDTTNPTDTPLYDANADGSSATRLFGSALGSELSVPLFSPDGRYVAATSSSFTASGSYAPQTWVTQLGGGYHTVNDGFQTWCGDSQAMVMSSSEGGPLLYMLADGTTRPLEANSYSYVWGNY
jgi:Tol biopolymer transport system component